MATTQASMTLNPVVRGDDIMPREFTFIVNDLPVTIESAYFRIRGLTPISCECEVNKVTTPRIKTDTIPAGIYKWDLRIVIGGISKTWLTGTIKVLKNARG